MTEGMLNMISPIAEKDIESFEKSMLSIGEYTLHEHTWSVKRKQTKEWVLSIDMEGAPRVWKLTENPLRALNIKSEYIGKIEQRWLNYEGTLEPGEHLNYIDSNKTRLTLKARGTAYTQTTTPGGMERVDITINNGTMKGGWALISTNPGDPEYIFNPYPYPADPVTVEHSDIRVEENPSNFTLYLYPATATKEVSKATQTTKHDITIPEYAWIKLGYYDRPDLNNGVLVQSIILPKSKYTKEDVKTFALTEYIEWRGNRK